MKLTDRIAELVSQHGSLRAAARVIEIDVGYLSRLASGEKSRPKAEFLRRMGLKAVIDYERIGKPLDDWQSDAIDVVQTIDLALKRGYEAADILDENSPIRDRIRLVVKAHGVYPARGDVLATSQIKEPASASLKESDHG